MSIWKIKKRNTGNSGSSKYKTLRSKFELMELFIYNAFGILLVSETKIDSSFTNSQFCLDGCRMFRHDRNTSKGGLCMYVNENEITRFAQVDSKIIYKNKSKNKICLYP